MPEESSSTSLGSTPRVDTEVQWTHVPQLQKTVSWADADSDSDMDPRDADTTMSGGVIDQYYGEKQPSKSARRRHRRKRAGQNTDNVVAPAVRESTLQLPGALLAGSDGRTVAIPNRPCQRVQAHGWTKVGSFENENRSVVTVSDLGLDFGMEPSGQQCPQQQQQSTMMQEQTRLGFPMSQIQQIQTLPTGMQPFPVPPSCMATPAWYGEHVCPSMLSVAPCLTVEASYQESCLMGCMSATSVDLGQNCAVAGAPR